MDRTHLKGVGIAAALYGLGWWVCGAQITRGPVGLSFYLFGVFALWGGWLLADMYLAEAVMRGAQAIVERQEKTAMPPASARTYVDIEAFEQLRARMDGLEKKVTGLSFVMGMRARRGAGTGMVGASESTK